MGNEHSYSTLNSKMEKFKGFSPKQIVTIRFVYANFREKFEMMCDENLSISKIDF